MVTGYESVAAIDTQAIEEVGHRLRRDGAARARGRPHHRQDDQRAPRPVDHRSRRAGVAAGEDVTAVIGHAGSSKFGLLLGSTASYVVHHARLPVVVVRGELRVPVRTVVVGVDEPHQTTPTNPRSSPCAGPCGLPGATRVEVHHAAFVPGVAAGPVAEPAIESEPEADETTATSRRRSPPRPTAASDGGRGRPRRRRR